MTPPAVTPSNREKTVEGPRPTESVAAATRRMVRALGRRISNGDPSELPYLLDLEQAVGEALAEAVQGLRDHGHNDTEIGEALGVTRPAVSKRWPGGGRYLGAAGRYRKSGGGDA